MFGTPSRNNYRGEDAPATPPRNQPVGKFIIVVTIESDEGKRFILVKHPTHYTNPHHFTTTVDDFQDVGTGEGVFFEVFYEGNFLDSDIQVVEEEYSTEEPSDDFIVPTSGVINVALCYIAAGATDNRLKDKLHVVHGAFDTPITPVDVLTKRRRKDNAVHSICHVDANHDTKPATDHLILLYASLPESGYQVPHLEAVRLFVPLDKLPHEFCAMLAAETQELRMSSAKKKLKFNRALEAVTFYHRQAPPKLSITNDPFEAYIVPELTDKDVDGMSPLTLKNELKKRELKITGRRHELEKRLKDHLTQRAAQGIPAVPSAPVGSEPSFVIHTIPMDCTPTDDSPSKELNFDMEAGLPDVQICVPEVEVSASPPKISPALRRSRRRSACGEDLKLGRVLALTTPTFEAPAACPTSHIKLTASEDKMDIVTDDIEALGDELMMTSPSKRRAAETMSGSRSPRRSRRLSLQNVPVNVIASASSSSESSPESPPKLLITKRIPSPVVPRRTTPRSASIAAAQALSSTNNKKRRRASMGAPNDIGRTSMYIV